MKNVLVAVVLLLPAFGCGDDDDNASSADITACEDLADGVATRTVECAEQQLGSVQPDEREKAYQASYDSFVYKAVGGSCSAIKSVRDSQSLYDECLPALPTLSCDNVLNGILPAVCQKQLIRNEE